jgi:hypothetical protein
MCSDRKRSYKSSLDYISVQTEIKYGFSQEQYVSLTRVQAIIQNGTQSFFLFTLRKELLVVTSVF